MARSDRGQRGSRFGDRASQTAAQQGYPSARVRGVRPESRELGLIYEYRLIVHPAALPI
jgi:hypothetical protein